MIQEGITELILPVNIQQVRNGLHRETDLKYRISLSYGCRIGGFASLPDKGADR
ncbi:hypothetical protein D3C84_1262040 [compost metagenome]